MFHNVSRCSRMRMECANHCENRWQAIHYWNQEFHLWFRGLCNVEKSGTPSHCSFSHPAPVTSSWMSHGWGNGQEDQHPPAPVIFFICGQVNVFLCLCSITLVQPGSENASGALTDLRQSARRIRCRRVNGRVPPTYFPMSRDSEVTVLTPATCQSLYDQPGQESRGIWFPCWYFGPLPAGRNQGPRHLTVTMVIPSDGGKEK